MLLEELTFVLPMMFNVESDTNLYELRGDLSEGLQGRLAISSARARQ